VLDRRKNLDFLAEVFASVAASIPQARLIVKCSDGDDRLLPSHRQIVVLPGVWSDSQISALYSLSNTYVSAHHGEAWGLTISDAMLMGKPAIATGYSGNLEFMDESNSTLIDYSEEEIRPEDRYRHFGPGMSWAYARRESLASALITSCADWGEAVHKRTLAGVDSVGRFDRPSVSRLLLSRLDSIQG
jgi:glycosyltransferase involved in cell wall biosynthesis